VSEVEVDCLTGDARIIRADVVMDVGASINPSIDIGQIEGAFVQGYGWLTTEELIWGDAQHPWVKPGALFTRGPGAYKIPAFNDVPMDFRVTLMKDVDNPVAVHSSKAIGEPPFFMATSAFFAIKDAVAAYRRQEKGLTGFFPFYGPASTERIRMACLDEFSAASMEVGTAPGSFQAKGSW
jgi:xanthine dehydrogenase/oxidase